MGVRLILYLTILAIGGIIGYKNLVREKLLSKINLLQTMCLLLLLFTMGVRIGLDNEVISSFFKLGLQAIVISLFTIVFSILSVKLVKRFVVETKREGEIKNES